MWTIFGLTILLACVGLLFLRLSGRKSIAQMTMPQILILLAVGTVLGTEVSGKGIWKTILALGTFIGFLIVVEWLTLHSNRAERLLKGMAVPVIQEGKPIVENLRRLRMSMDDLEKRLRIAGISTIDDIRFGTIESNGELGYELYPHAKPVTKRDLELALHTYFPQLAADTGKTENIFTEVQTGAHHHDIPDHLQ
ncbi:DUF421 domain-containing protein [Paenibacillus sp. MWE-103]|uniref:DUF421 domain-containing protein n=1 Tax=Paenibacillus artemisiicola TaxID=1172618 RepID=A0ABS3WFD3_9BACL|nr:YetF domain-containing protein [Paenibacillus artemisiicola]MBO7747034.1 DUF421 domain-containing protein [Paenibacillus artemisiicola]